MKHFQEGTRLDYPNESGSKILSGEVVVLGNRIAIATDDIEIGKTGSVLTEEVNYLPKTTPQAWTQGQPLYWDTVTKKLTTAQKPIFAGSVAKKADSADASGYVKLAPVGIPQAAFQANSTASDVTDLKTDFNALLAKLKAAGQMASS